MKNLIIVTVFMLLLTLVSCKSDNDVKSNETPKGKMEVKEFTGKAVEKDLGRIKHDPNSGKSLGKNYFKEFLKLVKDNPKSETITITYEKYYDKDYSRFEKVEYDRNNKWVFVTNMKSFSSESYFDIDDNKLLARLNLTNIIYWDVLK